MYQMLRLTIAAMAVVFASFPTSAPARVAVTQIKLTEKHVEGFIAAQKDMSAVVEKMMPGAVFSNSAMPDTRPSSRRSPTSTVSRILPNMKRLPPVFPW